MCDAGRSGDSELQTATRSTRSRSERAVASAYGPPADTPTSEKPSSDSASATAATSCANWSTQRLRSASDPPNPGRLIAMWRTPSRAVIARRSTLSRNGVPIAPWQ